MSPQPYAVHLLVMAKAPVPGQVKTRLCPPCRPPQAAAVAAAAIADTLATAIDVPARRHTLVLSGQMPVPPGWRLAAQRGRGLGARLAHAFADTALPGAASLLIGMDTPQTSTCQLSGLIARLDHADAVLGPAEDGGWWALALREPRHAAVLHEVPMSTPQTGERTAAALRGLGLRLSIAESMRDVDTASDAWAAARLRPGSRFAAAVSEHVPLPEVAR